MGNSIVISFFFTKNTKKRLKVANSEIRDEDYEDSMSFFSKEIEYFTCSENQNEDFSDESLSCPKSEKSKKLQEWQEW